MTIEKAINILEAYPNDNASWDETIEACQMGANALKSILQNIQEQRCELISEMQTKTQDKIIENIINNTVL